MIGVNPRMLGVLVATGIGGASGLAANSIASSDPLGPRTDLFVAAGAGAAGATALVAGHGMSRLAEHRLNPVLQHAGRTTAVAGAAMIGGVATALLARAVGSTLGRIGDANRAGDRLDLAQTNRSIAKDAVEDLMQEQYDVSLRVRTKVRDLGRETQDFRELAAEHRAAGR